MLKYSSLQVFKQNTKAISVLTWQKQPNTTELIDLLFTQAHKVYLR